MAVQKRNSELVEILRPDIAKIAGRNSGAGFRVHRNGSDQTIGTGSDTVVNFTNAEFDELSIFNLSTDRAVPTIPGWWYLEFFGVFYPTASNVFTYARFFINGSGANYAWGCPPEYSGNAIRQLHISLLYPFNGTTDYADIRVYQGSGGDLDLYGTSAVTFLHGFYLGPER